MCLVTYQLLAVLFGSVEGMIRYEKNENKRKK